MKKRILSALLVLCMACSMVSTVWATETNATSGAPEPASQTLNLDNEQSGDESGADSTGAPSDSTDSSTSASSDSTSSGSSSAASDAASDVISGEGDESAASSDSTAASDSTSSSSSASSDSSDSDADDPDAAGSDVTGDESGTGAGEESGPVDEQPGASSEPVPSQPNRAPAAAAPALPAETRATANTFHITWGDYFDVTVHYVDQYGSPIDYDFGCQNQTLTLTENKTLTFRNFVTVDKIETDTGTYTYDAAHYNGYNGDTVSSVSASSESDWGLIFGTYYHYYYTFSNGQRLTYTSGGWNPTSNTQTASIYLVYNYEEFQPEELPEDDAISIVETVAQDGMFTAVFEKGTLREGDTVTYTWEVSRNGVAGTWTPVESQKVTGENFNWQPDVDPEKINVAYDALLRNVSDDQRYFYRVTATVTRADGSKEEHQAQLQVPYYIQLQNGSFENPDIPGDQFNEQWPNGQPGLIWQTTGPGSINGRDGDDIEVILENRNGTQQNYGVNQAADGEQFAELNCEAYGALYQDVMTVPGTTLNWSFDHLARQLDGPSHTAKDKMAMVIMPADQADEVARELQNAATTYRNQPEQAAQEIQKILDDLKNQPGCYVYEATDGTYAEEGDWQTHESTEETAYTVPDGQYLTRFFFVSVDAAYDKRNDAVRNKYGTVGNLIDDVWFSTKVPEPDDDEAQLTVQKTVSGLSEREMEDYSITLTVTPRNGQPETIKFTGKNFSPSAGNTYTATKTITYTVAPNTGSKTVTVSESGYEVSGYEVSSTYDVTGAATASGTGTQVSNITIPARQNATVTFTNTYTPTTTDLTITKTFVGLDEEKANQVWDDITFTTEDKRATKNSDSVTAGGDGTFTATATISGLTIGQAYTITETGAELDGYTLSTTAQVNGVGNSETAAIEALAQGTSVSFTNTYTRDTGTLTIQKQVTGLLGSDSAENETFTVTITGPADAAGVTAQADTKFVLAPDGSTATATVTVKPGTNLVINNLPTDKYTVQETLPTDNPDILGGKYYFVNAEDGGKAGVSLDKSGATATIINNYAPYYSVTIEKQVGGEMGSGEDWFSFTVSGQEGGALPTGMTITSTDLDVSERINMDGHTFQLKANTSVTIGHLKASDAFVVTEAASASGYKTTIDKSNCEVAEITSGGTNGITTITVPQSGAENANLGTVTYINTRTAVAPTGLESNHTTPYVLMITAAGMAGLALIGGIVARRRRRRME